MHVSDGEFQWEEIITRPDKILSVALRYDYETVIYD